METVGKITLVLSIFSCAFGGICFATSKDHVTSRVGLWAFCVGSAGVLVLGPAVIFNEPVTLAAYISYL